MEIHFFSAFFAAERGEITPLLKAYQYLKLTSQPLNFSSVQDASKGKMFLAGERGHTETDWFRSYATFNFGQYRNKYKAPFGPLYVLNDDTLAGGKTVCLTVEEPSLILLLPVVGALTYKDSLNRQATVRAGEVQLLYTPKGASFELGNPFTAELINYLQLWFRHPEGENDQSEMFAFDIDHHKNALVPVFSTGNTYLKASIGKFSGREEAVYSIAQPGNGAFVFVLQGAFEVQYRLMEGRDGLALWDVEEIELEALSNEAIILLLEMEKTD